MANKIKYGLSNVYYAIATMGSNNTATYATPVAIPGAVSLSLDAEGGRTNFYADNIVYWAGNANNGYTGSLEVALLPESFEEDVLGDIDDGKHVFIEDVNADVVHFALLFQFEGDDSQTKHVLYNCIANRPSVSGSTKEDSIEPQTTTLDLTCMPIHNTTLDADIVKAKTVSTTDSTTYSGWFSAVYTGTAPST